MFHSFQTFETLYYYLLQQRLHDSDVSGGIYSPSKGFGVSPMTLKYWAGRAAADTLGYIAGNTYGAVGADILYQTMTNGQRTPPASGRRKRAASRSVSRGRTRTRRVSPSRSRSRSMSRTRSRSRTRPSSASGHGADDYYAGGKIKGRVPKKRRVAIVKLKPAMKRAIRNVMKPGEVTGKYEKKVVSTLWFGGNSPGGIYLTGNYDNKQKFEYLGVPAAFEPNYFLEAARILWKDGAVPGNSTPAGYDPAVDFEILNFKPTVIKSRVDMTIRNNSKRTYHLELFVIAPKKPNRGVEPRGQMEAYLLGNQEAAQTHNSGGNVFNCNLEVLGFHPSRLKNFKDDWAYESADVVLQPGQTYKYSCIGPSMEVLDFGKHLTGNLINPDWKYTRYFMVRYYTDLITSSGVDATPGAPGYFAERGRPGFESVYDGHGLAVDQTFYCHMKMPEQAGFEFNGILGSSEQSLNKRRDAFAYLNFVGGPTGTIIRVDDEAGGGLVQD